MHTAWEDQDDTGGAFGSNLGGTPGDNTDGIDGKVRITIDLSAAGIVAGESATVKYEVDNNADGTFDDMFTGTVDWEDATNHIWFGSRVDTEHVVTNFELRSEAVVIPAPAALPAGLALLALTVLRRRR